MKRRFLLQTLLTFVLLLGLVVGAGRLLDLAGGWRWDLGGAEIDTLSPSTAAFLKGLTQELSITYFVSPRERMPSHLKEVEEQVRRLLAALQAQAPGRVTCRVIYPETSGPAGAAYAAYRKASSFSVRQVQQDQTGEQVVWSSLALAWGDKPEALIQGVENAHLPYLEELIIEHLKALEHPPQPTFAVAAPPNFRLLASQLNEYGRVIEVDLDRDPAIPLAADVLFWIQPRSATPEHLRQLRRFVDAGRTAVLAGSAYQIDYLPADGPLRYAARRLPSAWEELLQPWGLRPLPDLLMDRNHGPVPVDLGGEVRQVEAPFHLRCLPAFYDLKSFLGPARGGLNFVAASALEVDSRRVAAAGFQAEVVGTTTEHAWVAPLPEGPFGEADLQSALFVPKQNLMVLLKADDPWRGQLFALASASPFQDGILQQPGYAHPIFLRTLLRTFADPQRLARLRVARRVPEALPPLGPGARAFWRFWAVFLVPLGLAGTGVWRYARAGGQAGGKAGVRLALGVAGGLALVLLIGQAGRVGGRLYLDLSADQRNTPTRFTRQSLSAGAAGLQVDLCITSRADLPPALKQVEARVRSLLGQAGIAVRLLRPEQLPAPEQGRLRDQGLRPFLAERVVHDTLVSRPVWSGLRLRRGNQTAVIPRLDARTSDHLEFLLVAALRRLDQGRAPRVALVADLPRLSPAEALEDYQRKGLTAPGGVDVYSEAKSLLADYGYQVEYVNPREPRFPEGMDLLLWLQPRRDSTPVALQLGEHLARGGKAMVALQHFNIQQRQYRGAGFQTVYWPQPQFQDLDPYLRLLGVEQVREVLMDRTQSHLTLETQVNRTAVREYDPQQVALPFLIRAVSAHFAPDAPVTRQLGDLLFIWGNRFAVDPDRLAAVGLRSQVLVATSDQAWAYPWQGGWLPPESFAPAGYLPGRQPLVLRLEGRFPGVESRATKEGERTLVPGPPPPAAGDGVLLLIGGSEMFKNDYLYAPGFQHDQFLLNAVADLTYGGDLAELQARRPAPRGFAFQDPAVKAFWRLAAVWTGPLLLLLYGLFRQGWNRRPRRRP